MLASVTFYREEDKVIWNLNNSGNFTVTALHRFLNFRGIQCIFANMLWCLNKGSAENHTLSLALLEEETRRS